MAATLTTLPDGFTLDQVAPQAGTLPPGFTPDPVAPGHPAAGPSDSFLGDIPRRLGTAAIDAVSGMFAPLARASPGAVGLSYDASGMPHVNQPMANPIEADRQAAAQRARDTLYNTAGVTEYQPSTEGGRLGQAALTGAAGGILTGGGMLPSAAGGAFGQMLMEHTPLPPLAAAMVGQLAGAKAAGNALGMTSSRLPGAMDPETRALAQTAVNDYGITVPMAKASNNPFVRYLDSTVRRMPFSGYGAMDQANQSAFNQGAASAFGETASKITPEVLNNAYDRIGNVFNAIGSRTAIKADPQLINDLADVETRSLGAGLDTGPLNAIRGQINKIQDVAAANNGTIPGDVYQNIIANRSGLSDLQKHGQGIVRDIGGDLRGALDDALQRSATPEDVAALQQARTQYKALKTVEPLTMRADTLGGATPTTGDISPAALLSRVNQQYRGAARAELGDIPLKDLAQIGQRFLKEPNSSGTAERSGIARLMETVAAPVGAILGHEAGVPLHYTLPPLAAALAGPPILGSILRSPAFVSRQVNGPQFSPLAQILAAQPLIAKGEAQ